MDVEPNHSSPVLADPASINSSRLGIYSNLLPYSPPGGSLSSSKYSRKKPGKLDEVCSSGWLDAMKSSSPPRKKLFKDGSDTAYSSWMVMLALLLIICHAICLTDSKLLTTNVFFRTRIMVFYVLLVCHFFPSFPDCVVQASISTQFIWGNCKFC